MMQLPCAVNGINKTPGRKKGRKIPIKPNAPSSVPCVLVFFLPHFHKFRIPPSWITRTLTAPQGPTRRLSRAVGSFFSALELLWRLTPARRTIDASRRGGWSIGQPAAQKFIELDPLGCIPAAHEFNQEELKFSFVFWRNNCWSVFSVLQLEQHKGSRSHLEAIYPYGQNRAGQWPEEESLFGSGYDLIKV